MGTLEYTNRLLFLDSNPEIKFANQRDIVVPELAARYAEATRRYMEAVAEAQAIRQRKLVLQEVLGKPGADKAPLAEQEFYELCIEESDDVFRPGFIVKQTRAQWSEIDRQVMWESPEWERWPTLKKAQERFEEWRKALAAKGFSQSDMDF